ncbi:MAG TPA: tetratricopeptide repeat protein [Terrimicrobiaceae bacterium]|nr:tetratricopeptide repeat protein [Terrimicrobiaceae bacterium]
MPDLPLGMRIMGLLFCFASALNAQSVPQLLAQGDALDEKNRNTEALALYLKADGLKPNDAEILRRISKQYAQLMLDAKSTSEKGDLAAKGLDAAKRSVAADPNNSQAHLALAIVYGRIALDAPSRRKIELSRLIQQEAQTATRLDPKNDIAWYVLGRWNYEIASFNPFLKTLAQAIYGKLPDASMEKAADCFQQAIAIQPGRAIHHLELGRTYLALGDTKKARQELQTGLALPSTDKDDEDNKQQARATLSRLK